ncbi:MAG TPA: SRPBCC family protein [Kineosporiaceae bacterium]|nr:SRPBCC family protein [Kineosporiaceae bacterium]
MTITDSGVDSSEAPHGRRRPSAADPNTTEPVAVGRDVVIQKSLTIYAPVHEVFERICDFTGAPEWRHGVRVAIQDPPGALAVGSRLHEEAGILGVRVTTETVVTALEPDRRWAFEHVSGPIPVTGEFMVEPLTHGTQLTYTLRAQLVGVRRHGARLASIWGRRTVTRSLETLRAQLESPSSRRRPESTWAV